MRKYLRFILISLFFVPSLLFAQIYKDPTAAVEERVEDLLSIMTLAEKVGQMTQAERNHATPEDVKDYFLGSILNGGGSVPGNNTPVEWADMIDAWVAGKNENRFTFPKKCPSTVRIPLCNVTICESYPLALRRR